MPHTMPNSPSFENDVLAHHARQLLERNHAPLLPLPGVPLPIPRCLRNTPASFSDEQTTTVISKPVGIIGAGPGGLYTALILQDLGIPYQILEAQDHVGGRLFTHTFPNTTGAPYNYYDVGAMRFPDILPMRRLFTLFNYPPLNNGVEKPLLSLLQDYYFTSGNAFMSFNGKTYRQDDIHKHGPDPFQSRAVIKDVPPSPAMEYIRVGVKNITDDVIGPFATRLLDDVKNGGTSGWQYMQQFDAYSTRSYMNIAYRPSAGLKLPPGPLSTDVINWCETFDKSTGWYDRSLSETVLEAVAFGWQPGPNPPDTKWYCLDGGAVQIALSMANYIASQQPNAITFNSRVTAISLTDDLSGMEVSVNGAVQYQFSHVISTLPLPVLRSVDMRKARLSPMQSNALRELTYGPAIKIGMQFQTAWWKTAIDKRTGRPLDIVGGQSFTDGMLRTIVYPSFGDAIDGKTTTLIASYCWTDDASRFGALIGKDKTFLVNLVVRELADIHGLDEQFIRDQLIDTMAWSWPHDQYTMGAYAFFGPGKFEDLYTSLNTPAANGYLHFAGEALSIRHAWVEGALDSAWRAVAELLLMPGFEQYRAKFIQDWGSNPEWIKFGGPGDATVFDREHSLLYEHIALTQPE